MHPLKILILGGTGFIGPHQLRYALARGHRITIFNRGQRTDPVPDAVEHLIGDRDSNLEALKGRDWDVCIDNPTSIPSRVRSAAQILKGHVGHLIFISTISVYASNDQPADETASLAPYTGADPMAETPATLAADAKLYGPLKAQCEAETLAQYGAANTTIVRAGLIVGPGDPTDRFTYWPARLASGGAILAPGDGQDPVQFIDVRDLAEWTIRAAEQRITGIYNVTGPEHPLTMSEMLAGIAEGLNLSPNLVWAPTPFLEENAVKPWSDLPVWIPAQGETAGFHRRNLAQALAAGLTHRPLPHTAADTLAWHDTSANLKTGMPKTREAQLLSILNK